MAEIGVHRVPLGTNTDLPKNRSTGDFGGSSSRELRQTRNGEMPGSHASLRADSGSISTEGGVGGLGQPATGSQALRHNHDATHEQRHEPVGFSNPFANQEGLGLPGIHPGPGAGSDDNLANAMGSLELNDPDHRYGVSGLKRNPRSFNNLSQSHGTGLHADDAMPPEIQPRTLLIHNVDPDLSDDDLKADLQSFGAVQSLYTGDKSVGSIKVTFFDSNQAGQAYALLNGRKFMGRTLQVDLLKSGMEAQAGKVTLFNISDSISNDQIAHQLGQFGAVVLVQRFGQTNCREVYFADVRDAQKARAALFGPHSNMNTINEDSEDGVADQAPGFGPSQSVDSGNNVWNPQLQSGWTDPQPSYLASQQYSGGSNQDLMALLNSAGPQDSLDAFMRHPYLPHNASSTSLAGSQAALGAGPSFGSSTNLGSSGNLGSTNNLAGLGGVSSSASHPDLPFLPNQGASPNRDGVTQGFTPAQLAALQNGYLGAADATLNRARRGMSTPDLTSLAQGNARLGLNQGGQWSAGAQYNPAELSGWGGGASLANDLDAASLLSQAQDSLGLGGLGAMQRSASALHLQQLSQQQQQQQLLMHLALNNPQALAQLSNLRLSSMPHGPPLTRGKNHRSDDNLAGGRLSRRAADPQVEAERKMQQERQYALDERRVERGEDARTTLMIKNIPNKYTQKMLLGTIDELFEKQYDFFYLPIDFKNKCNVGYAFINMVQPKYILPFMKRFNQRKWERFNSEKVCHISYARIQGKQQLVTHFQNSSLLHEDKRCRPILFRTDGEHAAEQEPFPTPHNSLRGLRNRSFGESIPEAS